jgi:hypothetical protein
MIGFSSMLLISLCFLFLSENLLTTMTRAVRSDISDIRLIPQFEPPSKSIAKSSSAQFSVALKPKIRQSHCCCHRSISICEAGDFAKYFEN